MSSLCGNADDLRSYGAIIVDADEPTLKAVAAMLQATADVELSDTVA